LVDFNETMLAAKATPKAKTTRRGRTTKAKAEDAVSAKPVAKAPKAPVVEDVKEEPTSETTENKE
jgi:hypothetical protein